MVGSVLTIVKSILRIVWSVVRYVRSVVAPLWGAADAEMKVPSVENTELKGSPFKAWSRSVYGHTC